MSNVVKCDGKRAKRRDTGHWRAVIFFFLMWTILKIFIEFVTILLLFYLFGGFGHEAYGIFAPCQGIEPTSPTLESKVLTTGLPGKSQEL